MLVIKKEEFDTFIKKLKNGDFKGQRIGQAFYNYFNLLESDEDTFNIHSKDGKHAINSIMANCIIK